MRKNKSLKNVILFAMLMVVMISNYSYAVPLIPDSGNVNPELPAGEATTTATGVVNAIIGSLRWIGYVIAIGMLIFVGIKYILSSADEKASMKGILVKVTIGSFIIIFANLIVNMVLSVAR